MDLNKIYNVILSESKDPNDAETLLTELMVFDNYLYQKISATAVKYGNGTHPKHRVTKYHDFFVDNVDKDESVLDLGCGRGDVTYDVSKKTEANVIGIDNSSNNIRYALSAYQNNNLNFYNGNIYNYDVLNHFDVVIMSNVLEHLVNRVDLLLNIQKYTTANKFLFRVPYFERDWTVPVKKELGVSYLLDNTHQIEYWQDEFNKEMEDANLEVVTWKVNWGEIWSVCVPKGS